MKIFENIEIKNFISIAAIIVWIGLTVYGCIFGQFETVFEFGQTIIMMVVSFFLGKLSAGTTQESTQEVIVTQASNEYVD